MQNFMAQGGLFEDADVISTYSRQQAIEDGVLVDLMQPETADLVREAGFKHPMAMTATAFAETVALIGRELPPGQDLKGRLWDILWMLRLAIRRQPKPDDRVHFQVRVRQGRALRLIRLWSHCGPGDDAEPVLTIMLEGED